MQWAQPTALALHTHALVIDSATEPGVLCRFEDALRDFELLSNRPELYMCGSISGMATCTRPFTASSSGVRS